MKILLISNMYPSEQKPYSGIFVKNQYEEIHSQLEKTDDSVEIFYMKRSFTGSFGSLLKYFVSFVKFIPYYFHKYDVIHLHYFYPLVALCFIYSRFHPNTKVIVTFHGGDINTQVNGGVNQVIFKYLSRCIHLSIAVGRPLEEAVKKKLEHPNTMVLCAGVDHRIFFPPETAVKKRYDIIFVGTFEERKGVDFIIDAIRKLDRKELRFCFIGSGPLHEDLNNLAREYLVDIFSNLPQSEIRDKFHQARYHTLPSRSEPFGLVVSEAMFCGVPSIVTDVGGLPEQVQDGFNGFICETVSTQGVYSAFVRALETGLEEWSRLSNNAIKNRNKFSLETVCREHLSIYRSLTRTGERGR